MGGKRLITHGGDVRIWDAAAGRLLHQIEHVDWRNRPGIHGMAVSPDGRWNATPRWRLAIAVSGWQPKAHEARPGEMKNATYCNCGR